MLNFIFQQRNNYGMAQRKINALLEQDGGCTLEQLLDEDEFCVQQCKQSNPKLMDFICQKQNLQKLIQYSTLTPADESHDIAHKYPFVSMDILCSCKQIAQALCEGGWTDKADEHTDDDNDSADKSENKMVRDILNANNDKDEKKETLVEELNLGDDGNEKKQASEEEKKNEKEQAKNDWSLFDSLIGSFVNTPADDMLSVLCGYFNKIIQALLVKENHKTLEYILLRKEGNLFDGLMKHISHHSLAILLIELLQVQIKPEQDKNKKISLYNSDGSDNENENENEEEAVLTADQIKMQEILNKKGKSVVLQLLDQLSMKNQNELEKALNAYTVLMEFTENDHCFGLLTTSEALQRLIQICCQGLENPQLKYAMNLLAVIITEFSNTEKDISDERKGQIQLLFVKHFADIAYNCVMVLYQQNPGDIEYQNQTEKSIKKIGLTRLRAIELLKTLFVAVQKMGRDGKEIVSSLLRSKVITAMLHMIKTYPFCSLSHAQCITILNAMKENFDKEDVQQLKDFVLVELEGQARFTFPNEAKRTCSGPNMGQITQIAFELRNLTQQELNEESSDEGDEAKDPETLAKLKKKRNEMAKWLKFCKNKIEKIEKVWNRKLEDPREPETSSVEQSDDMEQDSDDMDKYNPVDEERKTMPNVSRPNEQSDDIKAAAEQAQHLKDDNDAKALKEFGNHVFWKVESEHSLDDLLKDFE